MGIMQGGREAEEGIQRPPAPARLSAPPPPLSSLCEKALRISLACVHTRTAAARVCHFLHAMRTSGIF